MLRRSSRISLRNKLSEESVFPLNQKTSSSTLATKRKRPSDNGQNSLVSSTSSSSPKAIKNSNKQTKIESANESDTIIEPLIDLEALDKESNALIDHHLSKIDFSKLVPGTKDAILHILKVDSRLPMLLGDRWNETLFRPFLLSPKKNPNTSADNEPKSQAFDHNSELAKLQEHFEELSRGIIAQQVSGPAARSIIRKVKLLFTPETHPLKIQYNEMIEKSATTITNDDINGGDQDKKPKRASKTSTNTKAASVTTKDTPPVIKSPFINTKLFTTEYLQTFWDAIDAQLSYPPFTIVANTHVDTLRTAGLSQRKAEYFKGLAEAFTIEEALEEGKDVGSGSRKLTFSLFQNGKESEIFDALLNVRGLGPWSAEMFLLFGLKKFDIYSVGDLGVQRGFDRYKKLRPQKWQQLKTISLSKEESTITTSPKGKNMPKVVNSGKVIKMSSKQGGGSWTVPTLQDMQLVGKHFEPFRSFFMLILWEFSGMDLTPFKKSSEQIQDN